MVKPRDIAGNAEEEEEEGSAFCRAGTVFSFLHLFFEIRKDRSTFFFFFFFFFSLLIF